MDFAQALRDYPGLLARLGALGREPNPLPPALLTAKIKLLWQCNLNCTFCQRPRATPPMGAAAVQTLLAQMIPLGLKKVHFSGGEVLIHPDIFPILSASSATGLQVNLTSNGVLIDRDCAKRMADCGVHGLSLSLDGPDAKLHDGLRGEKGAFKATLKAIGHLTRLGKGPRIRINTVACRENACRLGEIHALLATFDPPPIWRILPVDALAKRDRVDPETAARLGEEAKGWPLLENDPFPRGEKAKKRFGKGLYAPGAPSAVRCYMPWLHLFIDPAGFVYPCCMSRGSTPALGRFPDAAIPEILAAAPMRLLQQAMAAGKPLDICDRCDDFLEENGDIAAQLPLTRQVPPP